MRRAGRGALVRLLLLAAIAALAAAGPTGCRTFLPPAPAVRDDARGRALVDALRAEARTRRSLRGQARMSVDGDRGAALASYALAVQRPALIRVEMRGLFGETLGVLVTDGRRYDWFRADDGSREAGRVYAGLLWDVAGVPLTPDEAVDMLLGAPLPQPGLVLRDSLVFEDGAAEVEYADAAGDLVQRFAFDAEGRLRGVETRTGADDVLWEIRFDDFAEVDGSAFPRDVDMAFPALDARARVRLFQVELNPDLAPDAFVLKVPGG